MPKNLSLKKILILGSGPIIIGQAAEFDYSGTQACKAIREEGIETVLVNSNPATIMTDPGIADRVYLEPLKLEFLEKIIEKEQPDGILAGFGGQTALNLAMHLADKGILKKYNVSLLGVNQESIQKAEDREEFRQLMLTIDEPIPPSIIATSLEECETFAEKVGYPLIIRPAYTLGGTGGGFANNNEELKVQCQIGMENSSIGQILLEKSVAGWKEIEYEVMRDAKDNCIIICNMENFDPVGVHTGDSIVVAPSQTLRDTEYQMLRNASLKIIRSLKIEGGCNIQFALDPKSNHYIVIEVNPRVSRSSALASKAAGYPIAKIAAKIALGYHLDELKNYVTGDTSACFEPTLDYCVVKVPTWPFDKFQTASRKLGTQMKATGEVMAISNSFENALLKALTSFDNKNNGLRIPWIQALPKKELSTMLSVPNDQRIYALAEALRRDTTIDALHEQTEIDTWFLTALKRITDMEQTLAASPLTPKLMLEAEAMGFTDQEIKDLSKLHRAAMQDIRIYNDIFPVYKMVDTCGGEFECHTPYYYSCFDKEDESQISDQKKVLVIGSGPIRIGQGIEFDYCCVHGIWALQNAGYEAIMINNNPETVSTDFDTSDKLYFESLHMDDVMNVIKKERPEGVIVQFGGQTSLNLAQRLAERSIHILGTSYASIDLAEDREKFSCLLKELGIPTPKGFSVTTIGQAFSAASQLQYPLMVRPSYVIGGRAMQVVYNDAELEKYLREAVSLSTEHPVLIDRYIQGKEIEVDAISDGEDILIPGIMEHIEKTGVHSGDSISVYPPYTLSEDIISALTAYTEKISRALGVKGLINIQYAYDGKEIYVIEVNPRASRTVPILSKVTGIPMVKLAVDVMLGSKLEDMRFGTGLFKNRALHAVKIPVFSSEKLADMDVALGPEMRSTGEVLGIDSEFSDAVYKGFLASGVLIPKKGNLYISLRDSEKTEFSADIIKEYRAHGFSVSGSEGTVNFLNQHRIPASILSEEEVLLAIQNKNMALVVNVPEHLNDPQSGAFHIRRKATDCHVPVLTCMDTVKAFLLAIKIEQQEKRKSSIKVQALEAYLS
ncbi:carbamoyl-phosphate synthase (glutamine-hydrolyzing) large subunit [Sinanaerobacter sp. ZZT-01]|uniref:carbamoyl-phosphate synthase (glutamine-hydrolyzing) large subunit n=1 Tax=Sinanaerobacter sp. ZZT-01 TaxID=3111540 RepID=UPI002D7A204F|nr:carbamoyl-phosphate synthase (glutamine-hydrolyzing) large subunit [Sinanaerobacter sp. ZZT-01]WRR94157.1 carbamoyl-phosphate synthase (glutamine-hydrolyzing) large subunit [Sinanaerobacter sp. ZZT-01]